MRVLVLVAIGFALSISPRLGGDARVAALTASGAPINSHPFEEQATALEKGVPIRRELSAGQRHSYEVLLSEGTFARVLVEQHGIDLAIRLVTPDGASLDIDRDFKSEGVEDVRVVATVTGPYVLTVAPATLNSPPARYDILVVELRPASNEDRAMDQSRRLHAAAVRALIAGSYEEARRLLEQAMALSSEEDPFTADVLFTLSIYYEDKNDFPTAVAVSERAVAISQRTRGDEDPFTATLMRTLAFMYAQTNDVAKAEALARRALDIVEKTLPPEHTLVAQCLNTLAQVSRDRERTEALLRRALAIGERAVGPDHALVANILNELGTLYIGKSDYDRAEEALLRAQDIVERTGVGGTIARVVRLSNLGMIARERKDYTRAEGYYRQAASLIEQAFGPDNSRLAIVLNNMAAMYRARGEYARSLEAHLRVVRIAEATRGPYHPFTLLSLGNIARTYAAQGDIANAVTYQSRVDAVIERNIQINVAVGSERQRVAYLRSIADRTDRTISLNVALAPQERAATDLAALVLLQRKGRVLDSLSASFAALHERAPAEERVLIERFNKTAAELARLVLDGPLKTSFEEHQKTVAALEEQKERLEEEISQTSAEFRAQAQPVTLAAVQTAIPSDARLLEFAVYRPFDPKAERNDEAYSDPHYVAYVLSRSGVTAFHDLGDVRVVDQVIAKLRRALRDSRQDARAASRDVYERVMRPVVPMLADAQRVLISPDGALNLIPFEALVDDRGRYLVQRYAFTYLTSGRDLLRLQVPRERRSQSVAIAGPLFGEGNRPSDAQRTTTAGAVGTSYFTPLNGTVQEARLIKSLFPEVMTLLGPRATESALKQISAPRILHLATHGFFRDELNPGESKAAAAGGARQSGTDNPLLRSGLALAGANLRGDPGQDGILTALEASGLNLWGTQLVVLSACDTGVGEVRNGEGVYGLRRAFVLAGAESLVMSLWPVTDYSTRSLMGSYYRNLKRGMGRGAALRSVQLEMLRRNRNLHPFYWANFIQSGDWTELDRLP